MNTTYVYSRICYTLYEKTNTFRTLRIFILFVIFTQITPGLHDEWNNTGQPGHDRLYQPDKKTLIFSSTG